MLSENEVYRRWLVFAALLPYAVHHDHRAERAELERRISRERAANLMSRIPTQRAPSEPVRRRPVPPGMPAKPNTAWGTRSTR